MSLHTLTKAQIGVTVISALAFLGGIHNVLNTTVAAIALPAILCAGGSVAASGISLAVGIMADKGIMNMDHKKAFLITAAVSVLALVVSIVALAAIGAPALLFIGVVVAALITGTANTFLAYQKAQMAASDRKEEVYVDPYDNSEDAGADPMKNERELMDRKELSDDEEGSNDIGEENASL